MLFSIALMTGMTRMKNIPVFAGVKDGRDHVDTAAGVFLKAVAKVGVTVALLTVGENALHDAGDPDRIVVAVDAVHP